MPEICKIGPFTVFSYGLMLALAFIVCSWLAGRAAKKAGFNPDDVLNFCFLVFFCGIIGARLFYVTENLSFYLNSPIQIIMFQHGGMSWFGGLLAGGIAGLVYIRRKKLAVFKFLDLIIPYVALGQAIGRVGCLLNGCCYGKVSELGLRFPGLPGPRIPTQLYSSLLLLVIFVTLRVMQQKASKPPGVILSAYFFLYSLQRFFIEFWRADNPRILAGLTLFQLLSILMFLAAFYLFSVSIKKKDK